MATQYAQSRSRLSKKEVVSYGLGDLGGGLAWNAIGAFALYFYTDVALLSAALIGTMLLITRVLDAVLDIAVGLLIDRTHSRWGKARPYLLFGATPMALIFVLTFYVPDASDRWRLIYAYLTFFSLGLVYSFVNIAYSALLPMMTTNLNEKLKLGSARSVGTSLGVILVTALFMPAVQFFGKGDEKLGFLITALVLAVLCMTMLLITYRNCQERYAVQSENPRPVAQSLQYLVRNRAWLAVSGFATLNFVRFGAVLALTPYFAIHVLQAPWMISILLPALSGTLLFGAFIAPPILRKLGLKKGNTLALVASVLCYLLLPLLQQHTALFIACYVAVSLVLSLTMISIFTMASEAVDYHEQQFGVRDEGLLSAGVGFAIKVGMAVGSAAVAYGLAYGGYQAGAVTEHAKAVMSYMYFGLPVVVFLLQLICLRYYPAR